MTTNIAAIADEAQWLEQRKQYITSTESASLFGLNMPSMPTAFEIWHIKRGLIDKAIDVNSRMVWGRRLERSIAEGIAQDHGWKIVPLRAFAYDDQDKIGSSFDYVIETPDRGHGLLEVKTIAYRDWKEKFIEDDETDFIEAPAYYEVQVQHEMEVLNKYDWCCLAVFIMDTRDVKLIWRDRDRVMGQAIRNKVKSFWSSTEPPPPDLLADSDLLARLHRANSSDKVLDATELEGFDLLVQSYLDETRKEKQAGDAKKSIRSQIILAMGDHNAAWCNLARVGNNKQFRVTETKVKGD